MRSKVLVTTLVVGVTLLMVGIASAQGAGEFDVVWAGSKARANLNGSGCTADNTNNLDMVMEMANISVIVDPNVKNFLSGPNTGIWDSSIFLFGEELDGEGTFVISRNGNTAFDAPKKAAIGPSADFYLALVAILGEYAAEECSKFVEFGGEFCSVTRGEASWARNGERLTTRLDVRCPYLDDRGRERHVQLKINSGNLDMIGNP